MATARATLEVRAVAKDQMSGPLLASFDKMRDRVNKFGQSLTNGLNVVKAFFAIKAAGKVVDFIEKYSTGDASKNFLASQKALENTFNSLGMTMANELAPAFTKLFDGIRTWAEEWGPTIVELTKLAATLSADWLDKIGQGYGKIRNWWLEIYERTQLKGLGGLKEKFVGQMTEDYYAEELEKRRRRGITETGGADHDYLWQQSKAKAYYRFAEGYISADVPATPTGGGSKTEQQVRKQLSLGERLAERWTLTSDVINDQLFNLVVNLEGGLVNSLTEVALGSKKAGEAFKDFAQLVTQQVLRMFIETGVRGLFGGVLSAFDIKPPATQGFGGGGGGNVYVTQHFSLIDGRGVAEAVALADRETGIVGSLMHANAIRRQDVRQRIGRRR